MSEGLKQKIVELFELEMQGRLGVPRMKDEILQKVDEATKQIRELLEDDVFFDSVFGKLKGNSTAEREKEVKMRLYKLQQWLIQSPKDILAVLDGEKK